MDRYYKPNEQIQDYSIVRILGEGRYGIVYLAENNKKENIIIKQLKTEMLDQTKGKLFYEQEILNKLDALNFPKFLGKIETKDMKGYVLEYIQGKVFEHILFQERYKFNKQEIYTIATQLLDIIDILHKNGIVHRDIRPPNLIVKENNQLVLIDFGLARYIDNQRYRKEMDYWYLGDFLIHLYYTSYYKQSKTEEKPWYEELKLTEKENLFLKRLMGIEAIYQNTKDIRKEMEILKIK